MEAKQQIRNRHLAKRKAMSEKEIALCSSGICRNLIQYFKQQKDLEEYVVYGYYPCRKEAKLFDFYAWLGEQGISLAFPRVSGACMDFYLADFKTELKEGAFHIMEPQKGCKKAEFSRAYCLVPGSVFDRSGNRIGYGKGYYDRYFAAYPKLYRIGIAYESQIEERIKPEKHDRKMHAMVTEHGMHVICNKEDLWN